MVVYDRNKPTSEFIVIMNNPPPSFFGRQRSRQKLLLEKETQVIIIRPFVCIRERRLEMGGVLNAGEGADVTVCVRQWKSCLLSA
jgi:hypothetical protein